MTTTNYRVREIYIAYYEKNINFKGEIKMEENKNLMEMNFDGEQRDLEAFAIFEAEDSEVVVKDQESDQDVNNAVVMAVGAAMGIAAYVAYDKFVKPAADKAAEKISGKIAGFIIKRRVAKREAMFEEEELEAKQKEVEVED